MSIKGLDINNVIIHEGEEKRQVKYPKIYKHFKHDPKGLPNNYMYCTMFEAERTDLEITSNESMLVKNIDDDSIMRIYFYNKKWYFDSYYCKHDKIVVYQNLYTNHMPIAREVSEFLSKVPEGREKQNITGQIYRFEEVE